MLPQWAKAVPIPVVSFFQPLAGPGAVAAHTRVCGLVSLFYSGFAK